MTPLPSRLSLLACTALLAAASFFAPAAARGQEIAVAPTKASGVYDVGEKIEWRVEVKPAAGSPAVDKLPYTLKKHNLTVVKQGTIDLDKNVGKLEASLDEPGTLLVEFRLPPAAGAKPADDKKPIRGLGGAAVAPAKVAPSLPPPDDFDAFWKSKLDELAAVPMNPKVEAADAGKPNVEYYKVKLDNVRGTHVWGQLAKPKKEGKFPALLVVQYAGVYGLPKENVVRRAEQGWLCLNIMAHDIPFDRPPEFYKQQQSGPLKDYTRIGVEDRDQCYFLRMYLGCHRAADYLASRHDWDGRTLVVTGTSQGGMQAILTAAIHPRVTAMLANVPGGCDLTGLEAGRIDGWPHFKGMAWGGKDPKKAVETARYYDLTNWAPRIKCPSLVSAGLIDETCPAPGIFATVNKIGGQAELIVLPLSDHHGNKGGQAAYFSRSEQWLRSLAKGEAVPEKK